MLILKPDIIGIVLVDCHQRRNDLNIYSCFSRMDRQVDHSGIFYELTVLYSLNHHFSFLFFCNIILMVYSYFLWSMKLFFDAWT